MFTATYVSTVSKPKPLPMVTPAAALKPSESNPFSIMEATAAPEHCSRLNFADTTLQTQNIAARSNAFARQDMRTEIPNEPYLLCPRFDTGFASRFLGLL